MNRLLTHRFSTNVTASLLQDVRVAVSPWIVVIEPNRITTFCVKWERWAGSMRGVARLAIGVKCRCGLAVDSSTVDDGYGPAECGVFVIDWAPLNLNCKQYG